MRLAAVLVAAFASMAAADCFQDPYDQGTPKWDAADTNALVEKLILKKCEDGAFNGKYSDGKQQRSKAYKIAGHDNLPKIHIEIVHVKGGDRDLPDYECKSGLTKELKGCAYGGASVYENWSYRAQPYDQTLADATFYDLPVETVKVD